MKVDGLQALARQGQLYPAVVLHGGDEPDRRQTALVLARILLCSEKAAKRPCGRCRHCTRIVWPESPGDPFHPDFRVLERDLKTVTSVAATKTFLRLAHLAPYEARGQVFVIGGAESLSGEAANALLKTLEEPPTRTPRNFLLLCPSQYDLMPTVRSRSLSIYLGASPGPESEAVASLAESFAASIRAFETSSNVLHLLVAAECLAGAGEWQDPRATRSWSLAAAAVKESLTVLPEAVDRQSLLALAEDLLSGWQMRLRGIQPTRILQGLVFRHLAPPGERCG